jgi:putative phage-type endonuclease
MTEIIQGSPEWFAARLGKVTASRVADVTAKTKSGWGASRANYMAQLVAERLTGTAGESYTNAAMQWGTDHEPVAREFYAAQTKIAVDLIGFVDHPRIPMSGASPDGLIGQLGLVEIKCPNTATHIETLLGQSVPGKYISQMQWQMACTGRQWCDFVSFDPRMPAHMQMFVGRVNRDNIAISELESMVDGFLAELAEKVSSLTHLYTPTEDMS